MNSDLSSLLSIKPKPLLIIYSGPSGAGKDAVLEQLKQKYPLEHITTITTRPMRPGEKDGVHYHFMSTEKFQELIRENDLLEYAHVYGNWYGVPKTAVKEALASGKDTIIKVDIQGAATIKKIVPQAVFIFLTTPTIGELLQRLKERSTENLSDMALRTKTAEEELKQLPMFDYIVFNRHGEMEHAVEQIGAIITAEKCRVKQREISL